MKRFIITGAPGAGKTAIIRQLELDGFSVVEEAATDVIAAAHAPGTQPRAHPSFIAAIAAPGGAPAAHGSATIPIQNKVRRSFASTSYLRTKSNLPSPPTRYTASLAGTVFTPCPSRTSIAFWLAATRIRPLASRANVLGTKPRVSMF